jgi:hypothetical protein
MLVTTVKPRYNVALGTTIFQRYIESNVISRAIYMESYDEKENFFNVISRENVIWRYVISGFHCIVSDFTHY